MRTFNQRGAGVEFMRSPFVFGLGLCLSLAASSWGQQSGTNTSGKPWTVIAGPDRIVMEKGVTYLNGYAAYGMPPKKRPAKGNSTETTIPKPEILWSKDSGPGKVSFENEKALATTAKFSKQGNYVLKLTAGDGHTNVSSTVSVTVEEPPPAKPLEEVSMGGYKINNQLWNSRLKAVIVSWIPHCYTMLSDPALPEGGIGNFIEAGNKLSGQPAGRHMGAPWANAYVHNTVESMCYALMVDAQGDEAILNAQEAMRAILDVWIPRILSAQEPDGYLQTRFTLATNNVTHWSPRTRGEHEGYTAGYFIEAALAHYQMTGMKDARMYNAAKKLADCWYNHIGPAPKQEWYDGHQEIEQALVKLGRFINRNEGAGKGEKYIQLAKFLLDCRKNGSEYDQSHLPVIQQYEAVGHAVRASYTYSAMADITMETGNRDYQSATKSIWNSIVNRKLYVTGGLGSEASNEGFGPDYSLANNAYSESCANCGELFFQHKMNLLYHDAQFADLYEDTLYNGILGDIDLDGRNFCYQNPLDSSVARYPWHRCPCCVGNIPRALLELPTWMYAKGEKDLYVNLFIGSTVDVGEVAGTKLRVVQAAEYPWSEKVSITLHPAKEKRFTVHVREPNRNVSKLYTASPDCCAELVFKVNGKEAWSEESHGYANIDRVWKDGDTIDFTLPMQVQRVKASDKVAADVGKVALRYGPLIYNLERVDQPLDKVLSPEVLLKTEWKGDLLGGVMVIKGKFTDGSELIAIPNYARNNRGPAAPGDSDTSEKGRKREPTSIVWLKDR